jgi:two-component system, chemotaxis family, response regulator Rcp1
MGTESGGVLSIVLIEDNPSDVYLMTLALEESGLKFELTNFQSGADALLSLCPGAGALSVSAVPDLILLDLNTPRSDGFEVLTRIRGDVRLAFVPVAIVTSSSSPADQRRAESLGATTYIKKPTQLTAFIDDVGNAVRRVVATTRPPELAAGGR